MVDAPASIRVTGLQPAERAAIHARLVDGAHEQWTSHAEFVADAQGHIDTANEAPVAGSYKEVSAMGLVWSMRPVSNTIGRYRPPPAFGVQTIEFQLMRGRQQLAVASLEQVSIAEGVQQITLRDGALRGTLFLPPGNPPHPGILVLGGSEGGLPSRRAAWLASHGFAVLALAYFRYDDLPAELAGIPLEYFGRALNWMAQRPEIASSRLGIMGISRGAELALQLGSMFPAIKTVVAYSPADARRPACCGFTSVPYAWTWNGNPLAFVPLHGMSGHSDMAMRAAIEVERIQGPVLLISGQADRVWESASMADAIMARLKRHGFAYDAEHLNYPHAGHAAGLPEIVPAWQGRIVHPVSGRMTEMGGSPEGNIASSLDAIPKVIGFLRKGLCGH
jgi:dienelactone hydrolase